MFRLKNRLVVAAVVVASLVVCAGATATRHAHADGPAPHHHTAKYEIKFLKGMIDHHHMAVMMAELCEDRAIHEDLLELCDAIIEAQMAEIEQMQVWLHDWYDINYEPHMSGHDMHQIDFLASLDGEHFEIAFMLMMIKHHSDAIKDAKTCAKKAYHEELIDMCHDIVEAQTAEIKEMKSWLCAWYHICH